MSRKHRSFEEFLWDLWHQLTGKRQHISLSPPWDENWRLDEKFFKGLANWDNQHQLGESTFLRVVGRIKDATTMGEPFLALIPDAPFPARSLVQALSYLLELGVRVARAKGRVFAFVDEVSSWVVNIEANFDDGRGKFGSRARNNLKHMRDLLNEIFTWGWARLHDGRWEMLVHGLSIVDEIQEFNQRLSKTCEMLSTLQDINVAVGIDEILHQIGEIRRLQESQIGEILDLLKRRQLAEDRRQFLERTLHRHALQDTGYYHQGKVPCDPETRVEILAAVNKWVNDVSEGSQNFFWLTGDPGSGKSAITASFARDCKDGGVLWAQFFINRNNESTTNPRVYFPSIARQMAEHIIDQTVTVTIHEILSAKETLLDEMNYDQALEFFVKVVQAACDLDRSKPVAIIFDGLDETRRDQLKATATIFAELFTKLERHNAKVFISSRTEDEITKPFCSLQTNSQYVEHLHLDTSGSMKDVETYLRRNLEGFVETWELNWKQWPGDERFQKLCDQAGGLFIWAVTVVEFFRGQLEEHGRERLKKILDVFSESGMGDVNKVYAKILEMTIKSDGDDDHWKYERFRWILGFIIALKEPLAVGDLSGLLDLRETPESDPVDIIHFVTKLRTVLVAGTENIGKHTIPRLHKSFVEYITSKRADARFRVDATVVDRQIATKSLRLVRRLRNAGETASLPVGSVRYAIHNWTRHLPAEAISESGVGIVGGDAEGFWSILSTSAGLSKATMSTSGDYRTHMYDPKIGLPPRSSPVQYSHSSTIRGSNIRAIAVSLDSRLIASGDESGAIQIWDSRSHTPIRQAGKHGDPVRAVCFSPDSRWLVSGSKDKSVRMWDCGTGQAICPPLLGHSGWITSVCTDGQRIVSGGDDGTICIWSCDTHKLTGTPINAGKCVYAVALSNGRIAAGVDCDIHIFNIDTGQQISLMKGTDLALTIAFSPDGSEIASGSADSAIRIWDVQTGNRRHKLDGHTGSVNSLAFSPDDQLIASGSDDKTVRVWNSRTGQPVGHPVIGHTSYVMGVAFSPDDLRLISGSFDRTIRIWSPQCKWQKPSQLITAIHLSRQPASSLNRNSLEGPPSVLSTCCSSDGSLYAASTLDQRISIWNGERKLIWETDIAIHPIHLLRLSETQLVLSTPDGSASSWNVVDGKPTHEEAITRGPRFNKSDLHESMSLSDDISWFPFDFNAGLWAYVDGSFIRFEGEDTVTIIDAGELSGC